jgi:acetyl esterase/lipase
MASQEHAMILGLLRARPPERKGSIEAQREHMDSIDRVFRMAADVRLSPVVAGSVPAHWVEAPGASADQVILYLHGGGYALGSIRSHGELIARIARATGRRALAPMYRLAPEHPFPAAVDDAVAAYRWLLAEGVRPENIVIVGDSAGGGLVMAALLSLRDAGDPLPLAAICLSPWVDLEAASGSIAERAHLDPIIDRPGLLKMAEHYLVGGDPRHPLASPVHADLTGLPPLLIQVGTAEVLFDDAARLAEKARLAGIDVTFDPWEEMLHVWHVFAMLPEARQAIERIAGFIRARVEAARAPGI